MNKNEKVFNLYIYMKNFYMLLIQTIIKLIIRFTNLKFNKSKIVKI